ncbi:putative histone-arginine methyltransferase 1.3 [Trifolium repens]|nr:putative histone-arginine methyltransferase 1.3 [Trifolium repens]
MEGKHSSLLVIIKSKQLLFILVGFLLLSVDLTQLLQIYSTVQRWLSTAPGSPTTHWYQRRCVLSQPIYVMAGQEITGRLHLIAHNAQSYTIYLTLSAKMWGPGAEQGGILQTSYCKLDLKEPYYRMSQPQAYPLAQDQQPQPLVQTQVLNLLSCLSFSMLAG